METKTSTAETSKEKQVEKKKTTVIFNKIDLTKAVSVARQTQPIKKKQSVTKTNVKVSKNYQQGIVTIMEDTVIEVAGNSIKKFIKECHPDVQSFISLNKTSKITVFAGGLIIDTINGFRIKITVVGDYTRRVIITNKKRKTIFNDITVATIIKETVPTDGQVVNNKNNNHGNKFRKH